MHITGVQRAEMSIHRKILVIEADNVDPCDIEDELVEIGSLSIE
jgi:hypothetical protein